MTSDGKSWIMPTAPLVLGLIAFAQFTSLDPVAGAEPDNPKVIPSARAVLNLLYELGAADSRERKIIAGHFCGGAQAKGWSGWEEFARGMGPWEFSLREVEEIRRRTGKTVGNVDVIQP